MRQAAQRRALPLACAPKGTLLSIQVRIAGEGKFVRDQPNLIITTILIITLLQP